MTIEKAYELITNIVQGDGINMTKEKDEALYYAQKAMEKQIPQKVIPFCGAKEAFACPECGTFQGFSVSNENLPF